MDPRHVFALAIAASAVALGCFIWYAQEHAPKPVPVASPVANP